MAVIGAALFDTAIGRCGVAWSESGLCGVQLPERDDAVARARLARRFPGGAEGDPPTKVQEVIGLIRSHLDGEVTRYDPGLLDLTGVGDWEASVYRAALAIPYSETRSYGALAVALDAPHAAQAVGQALRRNPWPIIVPCHRILAADGRTGGFSAPGGAATKLRLLEIEGALTAERLPLFGSANIRGE